MKKWVAALPVLLCSFGTAVVVAQSVAINTDAILRRLTHEPATLVSSELKRMFPTAAAFSAKLTDPPHYKVYATDPQKDPAAQPVAFAFWTTDLVPTERGYHGPIVMLVGMDLTGSLLGVRVVFDSEPYGYFSVEPKEFEARFKGKSIRDPFRVGEDIDAISRATLSVSSATRAIRDSSRMVARKLLTPDAVKK